MPRVNSFSNLGSREGCPDNFLAMFKHFLHLAFRAFFKDRTSGLINIVGLSLGMTGALLIGMWVNNELSYDRYHDHAERIYWLKTHIKINDTETWHWSTTPLKLANILGTQLAEVELIDVLDD